MGAFSLPYAREHLFGRVTVVRRDYLKNAGECTLARATAKTPRSASVHKIQFT